MIIQKFGLKSFWLSRAVYFNQIECFSLDIHDKIIKIKKYSQKTKENTNSR